MVDLKSFDLNLLVALDALIIEGSVSGAARRIGIGQPAMSHALGRLRDLLGDPLLVRVRSTMRPTPRALELAEPVARVLADISANVLADRAFLPEREEGVFRLGASDYVMAAILPKLLAVLHVAAPNVQVAAGPIARDESDAKLTNGLGRYVGCKVHHIRDPMWMFLKAARMGGIDPFLLSQFPAYMADQDSGAFAHCGVTDHVLEVTGQRPEDFEIITRRYAAQPKARRTRRNTLRALGAFMAVPLRPGLNPARYERQQNFPMPSAPRLAMQDEQWRAQRAKTAASAKVTSLKLAASA